MAALTHRDGKLAHPARTLPGQIDRNGRPGSGAVARRSGLARPGVRPGAMALHDQAGPQEARGRSHAMAEALVLLARGDVCVGATAECRGRAGAEHAVPLERSDRWRESVQSNGGGACRVLRLGHCSRPS